VLHDTPLFLTVATDADRFNLPALVAVAALLAAQAICVVALVRAADDSLPRRALRARLGVIIPAALALPAAGAAYGVSARWFSALASPANESGWAAARDAVRDPAIAYALVHPAAGVVLGAIAACAWMPNALAANAPALIAAGVLALFAVSGFLGDSIDVPLTTLLLIAVTLWLWRCLPPVRKGETIAPARGTLASAGLLVASIFQVWAFAELAGSARSEPERFTVASLLMAMGAGVVVAGGALALRAQRAPAEDDAGRLSGLTTAAAALFGASALGVFAVGLHAVLAAVPGPGSGAPGVPGLIESLASGPTVGGLGTVRADVALLTAAWAGLVVAGWSRRDREHAALRVAAAPAALLALAAILLRLPGIW
jgi:hypothetical protein